MTIDATLTRNSDQALSDEQQDFLDRATTAAAATPDLEAIGAALIDLAQWIQNHFVLGGRPSRREATEAERIYNEIVRRIGEARNDGQEG